jgi:hypothetical protein
VKQSENVSRRFTLIASRPFAYGTAEQRAAWRSLVSTLEGMLCLHEHRLGTLVALDEYLYQRTSGMIGSLSQLLRGAAILAIEDGTEQISRELRVSRRSNCALPRCRISCRQTMS